MSAQQQERWMIEGRLAGAKRALDEAEIAFDLSPDGRLDDRVIRKLIDGQRDLLRAITQIDTRLQRLEGEH